MSGFILKIFVFLLFLPELFFMIPENFFESQRYAHAGAPSCQQMASEIVNFCSGNEKLAEAKAETLKIAAFLKNSRGAAERGQGLQTAGHTSQAKITEAQQMCKDANRQCHNSCDQEIEMCNFGPCQLENLYASKKQCTREYQTANSMFDASLGEIGNLLAGLANFLSALGVFDKDPPKMEGSGDDEDCKGPHAATLLKCTERSNPIGGRAGGISGPGSGNGGISGGGPLFEVATQEKPGGQGGDNSRSSTVGGNRGPNGFGGFGGTAENGLASGNEAGTGGSSEDEDDYGRYMGTGSSSGGTGSAGGLRGLASFGKFSAGNGDTLASKSDLDKKLKKYSNTNTRSPASIGAVNGPFQDNWEVVRKAYKRNSGSLLH